MRENWTEVELGEIFKIVSGNTPKGLKEVTNQGDIPFYKVSDMNHVGNEVYMKKSNILLTSGEFKNLKLKSYPKGSVIFPKRGGAILTNKKRVLFQDSAFDLNLMGVLPTKYVENAYLFLWFQKLDLRRIYDGTNVPQINNKNVVPLMFQLAPHPEQRAIVSKMEELFSDLDRGIADLKKAQDQLKVYRQAVLKKAFDLDSPKYKIEKICKEIFAGGDKPKDFFSKTKTKDLTIPILANAVANNGLYGYTKTARVNEIAITIAGRGSGTGHVALRKDPFFPIVRLITIIPNFDKVVIEYLIYFLKNLNIKGSGSAIPQLTIPMVKGFEIHLPSIEVQHQIIKEIESRLSVCEKVEQSITESLIKAKALRQSILKKAFEGSLLSVEEITACKAAKDYEPASVLLKKIKAEKKK